MRAQIRIGRFRGTDFYGHISGFLVVALVIWSLDVLVLPVAAPGLSLLEYWEIAIGTGLLFLLSVLLHELAHLAVARRHGVRVREATIYGFVGAVHLEEKPDSPGATAAIALAGPVMSLLLAALFSLVWWLGQSVAWLVPAAAWLAWLNAGVALFNLLPVPPLAGWRLAQALAWRVKGRALRFQPQTVRFLTEIAGAVLIFTGFVLLVLGSYAIAAWLGLLGWVLQQIRSAGVAQANERMRAQAPAQRPLSTPTLPTYQIAPRDLQNGEAVVETAVAREMPLSSSAQRLLNLLEDPAVQEVVLTQGGKPVAVVALTSALPNAQNNHGEMQDG